MKVIDLINWLKDMPPDADVKLSVPEREGEKVDLDAITGGTEEVTLIG